MGIYIQKSKYISYDEDARNRARGEFKELLDKLRIKIWIYIDEFDTEIIIHFNTDFTD